MSRRYWAGIVVAMLAIFGVGMLVAHGVNQAKGFVDSTLPSPWRMMMNTGFRVDGDRIGDVQRLQFLRSGRGQFDSAVVTVKVDDSAVVRRIAACTLRATNAHPFGSGTRFVCASHADSANLDLVPFGHIEVLPDGRSVAFYIARSMVDDMHQHAYRGAGDSDSGNVDINATDGNFRITVNGREIFSASGDSAGGSLVIRDPKTGQPIVQISGDSTGGSVQVIGKDGKKIVNIHGTSDKKAGP